MKIATQEQRADAAFLVSNKWACLFSEPGTGKTLTAITARKALPEDLRTLVIAPKIALTQWQNELAEQGIEAVVLRKGADYRLLHTHGVVITTWALMAKNAKDLEAWQPEVIMADESHACIDYKSQRTAAFFGKYGDGNGLATSAEWCWMLTGTPIVRFADDLWPMLSAMFPEKLKDLVGKKRRQAFCDEFVQYRAQTIPGGRTVRVAYAGKNEAALRSVIYYHEPIAVRRKLADVDKDLPALRERAVDVDLDDLPADIVKALKGLTDEDLKKDTDEVKSIRRAFGRGKVTAAVEHLASIDEPVLALAWHTDVIVSMAMALKAKGKRVRVIDGSVTSADERTSILNDFQMGLCDVLIGQIGAVGTALDGLQHACKRVVFVERIGSPALMGQAVARVQRRGQRQSVLVETLRAQHRLEKVTDDVLAEKTETQRKAIG